MTAKKHTLECEKEIPSSFCFLAIVNSDSLVQTSWNLNRLLPIKLTSFEGLTVKLKDIEHSIPAFFADDEDTLIRYFLFPNKINDTTFLLPKLKTVNYIMAFTLQTDVYIERLILKVKELPSTITVTPISNTIPKYIEKMLLP